MSEYDTVAVNVISGTNYIKVLAGNKSELVASLNAVAYTLGAREWNKLSVVLHYIDDDGVIRPLHREDFAK